MPNWERGDYFEITHLNGNKALACGWSNRNRANSAQSFACFGCNVSHGISEIKEVRQLIVLDPDDWQALSDLFRSYDVIRGHPNVGETTHNRRVDYLQTALQKMRRPQPVEVYSHVVISSTEQEDTGDKVAVAMCGKVWKPGAENIEVKGHCPECQSLAGVWTA